MPPLWKNAQATARAAVIFSTVVPIPPTPVVAAPISHTPVTISIAPTTAPGPTTAAANANILYEGESFHLENVSVDEGDKIVNSPAPAVRPAVGHSPLQTAMNTTTTNPLATGGQAKSLKSSANIHFFFRQDPITLLNICKACEAIHNLNNTHHVMSYLPSTGTSACCAHAFADHIDIYLEEAEHQHWHVLHKSSCLKTFLERPDDSLSTPPSPASLPGTSLSAPDDVLPAFNLDKMHKQIMKFIVADDQAINIIECPEFHCLIHLRPSVNETNIYHHTKVHELVIDTFHEYFNAFKKDLTAAQRKVFFTSDLWSDSNLHLSEICESYCNASLLKCH
ncbi:hypothetical protein BDR06DRAFT_1002364 [Suillus hirtellus]|nr:hypothetical protein BDR06DRAFT_1002364 [Suillus hirtellus]